MYTKVDLLSEIKDFSLKSRVWVYVSDRVLSHDLSQAIQNDLTTFVASWQAHGAPLKGLGRVLYNTIIILIVDEEKEPASGCSIDSSVHFIKSLGKKYSIDFFNRNLIAYKDEQEEVQISSSSKKVMISDKLIVNANCSTLTELKKQLFIPYSESAHANIRLDDSFTLKL